MLDDYSNTEGITMDIPFFVDRIFYYTSGYPYLAGKLCKIIAEEIMPAEKRTEWLPADMETAVQILLSKDTTNFQSLIKNLENNPDLYELVFQIVLNKKEYSFNTDNPIIRDGNVYGVLRKGEGNKARVHNRLYEQRIYNYMASKMEISGGIAELPVVDII
ncbi:MAG: hypothetical protein GY765_30595 [bacterium]|nr:hypothetical protein [bacterium]